MCSLAVPTGRGGDGPADSWLGGRPRYLDGRERPAPTCGACAAPLPLVAQISAPVDGRARALHVFGCPPCAGDARAWRVRRTQAAAVDALSVEALSIEPAAAAAAPPAPAADAWTWDDDEDDDEADLEALLRSHEAGAAAPPAPRRPAPPPAPPPPPEREPEPAASGPVLPRVALDWVAEPEVAAVDSDDDGDAAGGDDAAMRRRLAAYLAEGDDAAALRAALDGGAPPGPAADGDGYEAAGADDRFARRLARRPDQVVRYAYGAAPLWPAADGPPAAPPCACGAPRDFELQLMPTLAYVLRHDALDVHTVLVCSCRASCDASDAEAVVVRAAPSLQDLS